MEILPKQQITPIKNLTKPFLFVILVCFVQTKMLIVKNDN